MNVSAPTSALPPDRSGVQTEHRHPGSADLDAMTTSAIVALMADDHRRVSEAVEEASHSLSVFINALVPRMREGGRLIYLGAGTSGRLGVLDASECPQTFHSDPSQVIGIIAGGDAALRKSSEGREDESDGAREALAELKLTDRDTVLGIAAGGTTPYVLGGLRLAADAGAMTALLTCAAPTGPPPPCDHFIHLQTGPEILTGSTRLKAGSATKLALNIITSAAFTRLGKVHGNLMVDLRATNAKLKDRAIRILREFAPELTREAAASLLEQADHRLKSAIVMHRLRIDKTAAEEVLARVQGNLRRALGEGKGSGA